MSLRGSRLVAAVVAAGVVAIAVVLVVVLSSGGGDGPDVGSRYAAAWEQACSALRADARTTTTTIAARTATPADRTPAALRRTAVALAVPYVQRTAARLRTLEGAVPPPAWQAYHRAAVVSLRAAQVRAAAVVRRVRDGDLAALGDLGLGAVGGTPAAPADLRRRTPACTGSTAG